MDTKIIPVGVDDLDIQLFENQYPVHYGMSYNSYLVLGPEQTVLMDSVDRHFVDQWLENVRLALPHGRTIDTIVVQHMEPDHSSGIARLLEMYPNARVAASAKALDMLPRFFPGFDFSGRTLPLKEGDTLDLGGGDDLTFYAAPMVHWPEVIVSCHRASGTLFSADAFGAFGALQHDIDPWPDEARRYFINIVGKYGPQVQTLLRKLGNAGVRTVLPLHGHALHEPLDRYINLYDTWSSYRAEEPDGILIAYASVYGGTEQAAQTLAAELRARGREVALADLCRGDISEAVSQAFKMGTLVAAAITYDAGIMPAMKDFLGRLVAKGWRNRRVALIQNGSWAPIAAKVMTDILAGCRDIELLPDVVTVWSRPDEDCNAALRDLAAKL